MTSKFARLEEFLSDADIVEFVEPKIGVFDSHSLGPNGLRNKIFKLRSKTFFVEEVVKGRDSHIKLRHQGTWEEVTFVGWLADIVLAQDIIVFVNGVEFV